MRRVWARALLFGVVAITLAVVGPYVRLGGQRAEPGLLETLFGTPAAGTGVVTATPTLTPTPGPGSWTLTLTPPVGGELAVSGLGPRQHGACPPTCQFTIPPELDSVGIYAHPDDSHVFDTWNGDCEVLDQTCMVYSGSDRMVTASFQRTDVTLTIEPPLGGWIHSQDYYVPDPRAVRCDVITDVMPGYYCQARFSKGVSITLEAISDEGTLHNPNPVFTWGGDCAEQGKTCTLTMDNDKFVAVSFDLAKKRKVMVMPPSNGYVILGWNRRNIAYRACGSDGRRCADVVEPGATYPLKAEAEPGYSFGAWGGDCTGQRNPCVLTVDTDKTVSVTFAR